jgi:hypothetical protein
MGLARNQAIREVRQERRQERQALNNPRQYPPVEISYTGQYSNVPGIYQEQQHSGSAGYSTEAPMAFPNNYSQMQPSTEQQNFFSSMTLPRGNHMTDGTIFIFSIFLLVNNCNSL